MKRYAAKLLFQFRVVIDGDSGKRRICEERIITLEAKAAKKALALAKRKGLMSQFRYENSDGNPVHFEFIGVMELLCLGPECEKDEVWYDIVEHLLPLERKERFISPESNLSPMRHSE